MNLKYKIVKLDLSQHSIVVRYYTDVVTENMLCTYRDPASGEILQCATDYNYNLPIPVPSAQALDDFIRQRAPSDWLATKEAVLDPQVDTTMSALAPAVGLENLTQVLQLDTRSPLEKAKAAKLQEIAAWRFAQETLGVNVGGAVIRTDRESQLKVMSTLLAFQNNLIASVQWKAGNGWITVNADQFKDIAAAVASHVQACFAQERDYAEKVVTAASVEDVAAITLPLVLQTGTA